MNEYFDEVKSFQDENGVASVAIKNEDDDLFDDWIKSQETLEDVDEPPDIAQFRKDRAFKLDNRKYSDKQIKLFSTLKEFKEMPEDDVFNAYKKLKRAWYLVHTYKMQKLFNDLEWKEKWVTAGILSPWPKVNGYFYNRDVSERFLEHLRETNPDFGKLN